MVNDSEPFRHSILQEETLERLKQASYPQQVSQILLKDLTTEGKSLLDAGAGPNPKLAEFAAQLGFRYLPLDINQQALGELRHQLVDKAIACAGVMGDVARLPFRDRSVDIAHERLVLMNIAPDKRAPAVRELIRVAREDVVLLEYNWRTVGSSADPNRIASFRTAAIEVLYTLGTEPYMGEILDELVRNLDLAETYQVEHFRRQENTTHCGELILLASDLAAVAERRLKNLILANELRAFARELNHSPFAFIPAEVVAATIHLS